MSHETFDLAEFASDPRRMRSASPGVYFLFQAGQLQYIGESQDCERRIRRHAYRIPYTDWRMIPVDGPRRERRALEGYMIGKFLPLWNRT